MWTRSERAYAVDMFRRQVVATLKVVPELRAEVKAVRDRILFDAIVRKFVQWDKDVRKGGLAKLTLEKAELLSDIADDYFNRMWALTDEGKKASETPRRRRRRTE